MHPCIRHTTPETRQDNRERTHQFTRPSLSLSAAGPNLNAAGPKLIQYTIRTRYRHPRILTLRQILQDGAPSSIVVPSIVEGESRSMCISTIIVQTKLNNT